MRGGPDISDSEVYFRDGFVPFDKAVLSIASAPVLYGLSIYTVFPAFWNDAQKELYIFRLADHFKRLQNSAEIMSFADFHKHWSMEKFEATIKELIRRNDVRRDSMVRVSVFVDDILKGTRMHGLRNSLSAIVYPAEELLPKNGARLGVSSWRRTPDNAIPSRAKVNGSYVNASLMKHEAVQKGFDDAIALDEQGHVAESTIANVFLVRHGQLITPGVATDLMEG
ncbi:MAG: aminotransferase class IV, partial [Candidatus Saccharimonadales bacterium]